MDEAEVVKQMRRTVLQMVYTAREGHLPSSFSIMDLLYVLYRDCLHIDPHHPKAPDRDRFILSKGHASAALYAVLSHFGFFDATHLSTYCQPGSLLGGHPDCQKVPGVEASTGSLGHGIAIGCGLAIGLRQQGSPRQVVVLVGDGEMDEGSFWESVMMAKNLALSNLVVIADCNGSQHYSHSFDYEGILRSMGWQAHTVDGHHLSELRRDLVPRVRASRTAPLFVRANTQKGYPIRRFTGDHGWHRRTPTEEEMADLMAELS